MGWIGRKRTGGFGAIEGGERSLVDSGLPPIYEYNRTLHRRWSRPFLEVLGCPAQSVLRKIKDILVKYILREVCQLKLSAYVLR